MQRRYSLAHFLLAIVVVLGLTLPMIVVDAQARIAFESDRDGHIINNLFAYEIYVMDANGGNQRNLTNNPTDDRNPSWSPDGKRIAFTSDRDGNSEIYVMDADGGNQRNLTNNDRSDEDPSWSPDGKRITFGRHGVINEDLLRIARLAGIPHGLRTANTLYSCLIGRGTLKST